MSSYESAVRGGGREIRTLDTLASKLAFQASAIDH